MTASAKANAALASHPAWVQHTVTEFNMIHKTINTYNVGVPPN
jgi:hypothetical protein